MVKRVTLIKLPDGCNFLNLWILYADLLFAVDFYFVSEYLPDDLDKFVGTVP